MNRVAKLPAVRRHRPDAEASLKRVLKSAGPNAVEVRVQVDDLFSLLDELRAQRAKNEALYREMTRPLPGLEDADAR